MANVVIKPEPIIVSSSNVVGAYPYNAFSNPTGGSEAIGAYLNKDYTTAVSLTDHTITNPNSTIALSGGYLNMTGGVGGFTNYIEVDTQGSRSVVNCLYKWENVVNFIAVDKGANGGLGIGLNGYSGNTRGVIALFDQSNGVDSGKVKFYVAAGVTLVSTSSTALTWVAGDSIKITSERVDDTWNIEVENLTTPDTITHSFVFDYEYATVNLWNRESQFALYNFGGEQNILDNVVTSNQLKNVDYLFIGDSITYGAYSGDESNRFWKLLSNSIEIEPYAGSGAISADVVAALDDIEFINPTNVIIMIGGNDISQSVPTLTWQANLDTIQSTLSGLGINIIWCYNTPRSATDITSVNTYITANYGSDTIIEETFTDFDDGGTGMKDGYNSGDNTHPSGWGNFMIFRTLADQLGATVETLTETVFTGGVNVTVASNSLLKTTSNGWDGSAIGTTAMDYTAAKIYFGIQGTGSNPSSIAVGYAVSDTGSSYTDIEQGIIFTTGATIRSVVDGVLGAAIGALLQTQGDLFMIELVGTDMKLYQNGALIFTGAVTTSANMKVKTSLNIIGDKIIEVIHT